MSGEKSHLPSAKKLRDARRQGQVAKSPLLTGCASFGAGIIALFVILRNGWVSGEILLNSCLMTEPGSLGACGSVALSSLMSLLLPVLGAIVFGGIVAEILQIGFQFQFQLLCPKGEKLDPVRGIARLGNSLKVSWLNVLLLSLAALIFAITLKDIPLSLSVMVAPVESVLGLIEFLVGTGVLVLIGAGLADYFVQRRRFLKEMSMTLEEVKREHKEEDGDPHVKSMRRALHRQLLLLDLQKRVRRAKVIVVARK